MAKWVKNTTASTKTWVGQDVSAGAYFEITNSIDSVWANNSAFLIDIANGDALIARDNSGNQDISDVSDAINHLKDLGITKIQTALAEDGVTDRPYGWAHATATKNTTTTLNFKIHESGLYMLGGGIYTDKNVFGDSVVAKIVDVDNVLGGGAGLVLNDYVYNYPVAPSGHTEIESNSLTTSAIPQNTYLQIKYTSIGTVDDVKVQPYLKGYNK